MIWNKLVSWIQPARRRGSESNSDLGQVLQAGIRKHSAGDNQAAEAIYRQVLEQEPDNAEALQLLGVVQYQKGDSRSALEYIQRAISLSPGIASYHSNLGLVLNSMDRKQDALQAYSKALSLEPDSATCYNNMGNVYMGMGKQEEAILQYRQALQINPDYAEAMNNLGCILQEQGRLHDAATQLERALQLNPDFGDASNNLGNVYLAQNRYEDAISCFQTALTSNPNNAEACNSLGLTYLELGELEQALTAVREALALQPNYVEALNSLGNIYLELGKHQQATETYLNALEQDPDCIDARKNLGIAYQELGKLDQARSSYEAVLELEPEHAEVRHYLTAIGNQQEQIQPLLQLLQQPDISDEAVMHTHYALGNIYRSKRQFADAFEHFLTANELHRQTIDYDANTNSAYIDSLVTAYSKTLFTEKQGFGSASEKPVFIVGMPRSGTSLVEQIISCHSRLVGGGELTDFARLEHALSAHYQSQTDYPDCISLLEQPFAKDLTNRYLQALDKVSSTADRVSDKLPGNFLRVGLIKLLFPHARIIHCRRSPLDTCISIYTNYFARGYKYGYRMHELAQYYKDYERLMAHWQQLFGDTMFELQYEELVQNQVDCSRQLVDYLGLDWEEQCLDFHQNTRAVRTMSNVQVRQKMYSGSIASWKNYQGLIDELQQALQST